MSAKWDLYFMDIADRASALSKDQSTQLGAVIVGPDNEIRSTGFNSFPRGIRDDLDWRQSRPDKYAFFEHAERNAVYNAARVGIPLKGCRIYCAWPPCADCARAIIQSGLIEVVVKAIEVPVERWAKNMSYALTMLHEAGVDIREMER